jgi:N-methylhydantoinase A
LDSKDLPNTEFFLNGTTVGLNALLQRRGPTVGLLTTCGFRDVLELRRGDRGGSYDLNWTPGPPLVPRYLRLPIRERISASGQVLTDLVAEDVKVALEIFKKNSVDSIAVCFINAYANGSHELSTESMLRELGFAGAVSLSHRISGEYGEYERVCTTAIDAFVSPIMADYLNRLNAGLQKRHFKGSVLITRSGGGAMTAADSAARSFETIMSGPVAGASGAAEFGRAFNLGGLITADVGGTSFDTCLIVGGQPHIKYQGIINGMPVKSTWLDVRSIGAGGGSIARVDGEGILSVGPQSAGARPGPACYGRGGTEPTLTDAAFSLGMLGKGHLASGLMLDPRAAANAVASVATALGLSADDTARGIVRIAASHMANAIREITIEKGVDPRQQSLFVFGGAGPLMATQLSRELDISTIIIPPHCGNFSAWGLLGADLIKTRSHTFLAPLDAEGLDGANRRIAEAAADIRSDADEIGGLTGTSWEIGLDLRYVGQEHSLTIMPSVDEARIIAAPEMIIDQFVKEYEQMYGTRLPPPLEIVAVRVTLRRHIARRVEVDAPSDGGNSRTEQVSAYSFTAVCHREFQLIQRASLRPGSVTRGPAIVLEPTATTYVDAGFDIHIENGGCMVLRREIPADR